MMIKEPKRTTEMSKTGKNPAPDIMQNNSGELDRYLFHEGNARHAYDYMGAHRQKTEDGERVLFRVWAPHAREVYLTGDFCAWSYGERMEKITEPGIFELSLDGGRISDGSTYKYRIITQSGGELLKADPYGFMMETPPNTATVLCDIEGYAWGDGEWMSRRKRQTKKRKNMPMNIYELHLGSWRRHYDNSTYTYREIADSLAPYIKEMGYTHVELMPVMEHPFDGSWGYQICGYYAPTSRFGTPKDFMYFMDVMHQNGIGVILDWVPAHFPKDAHGLYRFDGEPVYEYSDPTKQENRGWGTCCLDVGRYEVRAFLISNAYYWIEKYHADGLRVDAVASMLYLDYDRGHGEWKPNRYGDRGNLEAIEFFRMLNGALAEDHPDVVTVAEESTSWANITRFDDGGLGFTYKWNMGWMNDTLRYVKEDPIFRKHHHGMLSHIPSYAFDENFILPISHDEVVHLKKSFIDKMPGDYWQKFAGSRVFAAFMMTHPGRKLWFMGAEIGQFGEWNYKKELDWFLLGFDSHARLHEYFKAINRFYLDTPALWDNETNDESFRWIDANNASQSVLIFRRIAKNGDEIIVLHNFTPVAYEDYLVAVPREGDYVEVFNSDDERFGGSGVTNTGITFSAVPVLYGGHKFAVRMRVPPLGCVILSPKKSPRGKGKTTSVKKKGDKPQENEEEIRI